jgi:hypothetical protein
MPKQTIHERLYAEAPDDVKEGHKLFREVCDLLRGHDPELVASLLASLPRQFAVDVSTSLAEAQTLLDHLAKLISDREKLERDWASRLASETLHKGGNA